MSAREEILAYLWVSVPSYDDKEAKARAHKMIDDLLHEEAEKIREDMHDWEGMSALVCAQNRGKADAADLIDPYVK